MTEATPLLQGTQGVTMTVVLFRGFAGFPRERMRRAERRAERSLS